MLPQAAIGLFVFTAAPAVHRPRLCCSLQFEDAAWNGVHQLLRPSKTRRCEFSCAVNRKTHSNHLIRQAQHLQRKPLIIYLFIYLCNGHTQYAAKALQGNIVPRFYIILYLYVWGRSAPGIPQENLKSFSGKLYLYTRTVQTALYLRWEGWDLVLLLWCTFPIS